MSFRQANSPHMWWHCINRNYNAFAHASNEQLTDSVSKVNLCETIDKNAIHKTETKKKNQFQLQTSYWQYFKNKKGKITEGKKNRNKIVIWFVCCACYWMRMCCMYELNIVNFVFRIRIRQKNDWWSPENKLHRRQ